MSTRLRAAITVGVVAVVTYNVVTFYVNGWPSEVNGWPGPGPPRLVFYVTASTLVLTSYLFVGVIAWQRHPGDRIGLLFVAVGCAWLLAALTNVRVALPYTIGNALHYLYAACFAQLALAWPYGRLRSRRDQVVVAVVYACAIGDTVVSMLFWNPRTNGCGAVCPSNLLLVNGSISLEQRVDRVTSVVGTCLALVVIGLVAQHWWVAQGYERRTMTRLILIAMPIAAYVALLQWTSNVEVPNVVLYGVGPLILVTAPAAYAVGILRSRRARSAVGVALIALEPGPPPGRLRDALAKALGDPTLQLAFRTSGDGCYIDTGDVPHHIDDLPKGRMVTPLDPGGDAVLIHDEELGHEHELVRVTAAAANLALEHGRLQAEVEIQLEQVRASRARIVEAGDSARRKLERDLHDGAQQRLATLNLALAMARERATGTDPELESLLESATKEARQALVELRELARGIHPAVLTETGIGGAVQALVERSPVPTTIIGVPAGRFPAPIEATAYFVVSEALANVAKHAPAAIAQVAVGQLVDRLVVEVSDEGGGGARPDTGTGLRGLADRVSSVGGSLEIDSPIGHGTRLRAEIPLS